jgi:hypothetical protein
VNRDGIGRGDIGAPDQQRVTATRILIAESSSDIRQRISVHPLHRKRAVTIP